MNDSRIPIYLITGFLDSGKTTLLTDTLNMDYFNDGQRTVLLMCEDGEVEYNAQYLAERNCRLIPIEDQSQLNTAFLEEIDALEALQDVAPRGNLAGALKRCMLTHVLFFLSNG